jgi:hypothetical protein
MFVLSWTIDHSRKSWIQFMTLNLNNVRQKCLETWHHIICTFHICSKFLYYKINLHVRRYVHKQVGRFFKKRLPGLGSEPGVFRFSLFSHSLLYRWATADPQQEGRYVSMKVRMYIHMYGCLYIFAEPPQQK